MAEIKGETIHQRGMIDLANHIRHNPDTFPEWVNSATAKLFSPPIFENKKSVKVIGFEKDYCNFAKKNYYGYQTGTN